MEIAGSVEKCFECSIFYSFSHPPIMSVLCRKSHQAQGMPDSIEAFVMGSLDRPIKELL